MSLQDTSLIILAPPSIHNSYYKKFFPSITKFYINYAKQIIGKDTVLLLLDNDTYKYYKNKIPDQYIYITDDIHDIWMRDFTAVDPSNPIQFRYTETYLGTRLAKKTQNMFNLFLKKLQIQLEKSEYFLDGGNFVNYAQNIIISNRFLEDNFFASRDIAKEYLQKNLRNNIFPLFLMMMK